MEPNVYNNSNKFFSSGKDIETTVSGWLANSKEASTFFGDVLLVEEVTDLSLQYQSKDFFITTASSTFYVDVKQDTYLGKSGNLLAELYQYNCGRQAMGWFLSARCEYLIFANDNFIYIVDFPKFKEIVVDYIIQKEFNVKTTITKAFKGKSVLNMLIPEECCEGCFTKYRIDGVNYGGVGADRKKV